MKVLALIRPIFAGTAIAVGAIGTLFGVASFFLYYKAISEYDRTTSPDASRDIVMQAHNAGATTGVYVQVYIAQRGQAAPIISFGTSSAQLVASADLNGTPLVAHWIDDQHIEISIGCSELFDRKPRVMQGGRVIEVEYASANKSAALCER